jgi:hypothetical protein
MKQMTATIQIDMDNAAFEGSGGGPELANILRDLSARLTETHVVSFCAQRKGRMIMGCFDSNGNKVGELEIK